MESQSEGYLKSIRQERQELISHAHLLHATGTRHCAFADRKTGQLIESWSEWIDNDAKQTFELCMEKIAWLNHLEKEFLKKYLKSRNDTLAP